MSVTSRPTPTDDYAANREQNRETENRFPGDALLRQYGLVIESRPAVGPPTWKRLRDGHIFTDHDARLWAMAQRARALKALETKA